MPDNHHLHSTRPIKRQKTRLACRECRERKIRCDGARPVCDSCTKKKLGPSQCTYAETIESNAQYVQELERRVRELEASRSQIGPSDAPVASPPIRIEVNTASGVSQSTPSYERNANEERMLDRGARDRSTEFHPIDPQLTHLDTPRVMQQDSSIQATQDGRQPSFSRHQSGLNHTAPNEPYGNTMQHDQDVRDPDLPMTSTMGATEETPSDGGRVVFLGRSSAAAFMKEVSSTNPRKRTFSDMRAPSSPSTSRASQIRSKKEREELQTLMENIVLPPRKVADNFVDHYWEHVYPLMPLFHRPSFMRKYNLLWHGEVSGSQAGNPEESIHTIRAFYATFNAILALGCTFSSDTSVKSRNSAEAFFQRSQELIVPESFNHGCLELVQALILGAQYLQSSDYINRCWVTIGTAIRVAQGIGIHLDLTVESQAEREERKRTWWCCVLMDRVHSMTFGRPPMVVWPSVVPYPSIVQDEELNMEPESASREIIRNSKAITAAFVNALKLSEILMEVLKIFYAPPLTDVMPLMEQFTNIQVIDHRLGQWLDDLPEFLRWNAERPSEQQVVYVRQAIALRCRFLHLQILTFRPTTVMLAHSQASRTATNNARTSFQNSMSRGCVVSCIRAAQELINIIIQANDSSTLPPWWYRVFCT